MKRLLHLLILALFIITESSAQSECGLLGFATHADLGLNGTTGGSAGKIVRVTNRSDFAKYASGSTPYVIIIENDLEGGGRNDQKDEINIGSNKTVIGAGKGVVLDGICLNINGQKNIILRNLTVKNGKPDGIAIRSSHHVWIDHCDLSKCDDGMLDFTIGSTFMTVSWSKFHDHDKAALCNSGTGHFEDADKNRVTYHHCSFINTVQRNPRVGYGRGHVFNCYYEKNGSYCVGVHTGAVMVVENCYFNNTKNPFEQMYAGYDKDSPFWGDVLSRNNIFVSTSGDKQGTGVGFETGYYYNHTFAMHKAEDVPSLLDKMGMVDSVEYDIIPFPGNGAIDVMPEVKLSCSPIDGATDYQFLIGTSPDALTAYDPATFRLSASTTYYWQAIAKRPAGDIKSETFFFTTASSKVAFPTPENGDMHAHLREYTAEFSPMRPIHLRWHKTFDGATYKVYLSEDADITDDDLMGETTATDFAPTRRLYYGKQYHWRVDVVTTGGETLTGDTWTFSSDIAYAKIGRTELEKMIRNGHAFTNNPTGYFTASGSMITMGEAGPGSMSAVWVDKSGTYDVTTSYYDEGDGQGWYGLYINEELKDEWKATADNERMMKRTTKDVQIMEGDEVRLEFYTHSKEQARADCIDIVEAASGITDITLDRPASPQRIHSVDGKYIGTSLEQLPKGVYIVGGKKVVK